MLDLTRNERAALIILLAILVAGLGMIMFQRTRPCAQVSVESFETEKLDEVIRTKSAIDINRATAGDFEKLQGIGKALAERIVAYRQSIGRFSSVGQLKDVKGIGGKLFDRIRERVSIE